MFMTLLLYTQGKSPWYPLGRRLDRSRASLDAAAKRKTSLCPYWELNPGHPSHSLISLLTEYLSYSLFDRKLITCW